MKVFLTGADGFIGRNLRVALDERDGFEVLSVTRSTDEEAMREMINRAEVVIHLAGVNRPTDPAQFKTGNADFTQTLCKLLKERDRAVPIAFASSTQATLDNPYGISKRTAEEHVEEYSAATGAGAAIYRLPNVFGKWCKPNYNSAVATFCHSIARGLPIRIHDPAAIVHLAYVDDVVNAFVQFLHELQPGLRFADVAPVYTATVGELAEQIRAFGTVRTSLVTERVGEGLIRALHATYLSYLPPESFSYALAKHSDQRGDFVEMLKTKDSGQFSYFTAHPGVTRGGHYHHTKTEKFLVVRGHARFNFRNVLTDDHYSVETEGRTPVIVETVPGWAHDVTNVGDEELVVLLWANEIFDREKPDTVASKVAE